MIESYFSSWRHRVRIRERLDCRAMLKLFYNSKLLTEHFLFQYRIFSLPQAMHPPGMEKCSKSKQNSPPTFSVGVPGGYCMQACLQWQLPNAWTNAPRRRRSIFQLSLNSGMIDFIDLWYCLLEKFSVVRAHIVAAARSCDFSVLAVSLRWEHAE